MNIPTDENDSIFIPEALKGLNNWCAWKLEHRNGKMTKVPYMRLGKRASCNNIKTWSSFDAITELLTMNPNEFNGYGFFIADGLVFIDVDHCLAYDGTIDKRGMDVLSAFPESYCEVSQSKRGIHILTKGELPKCFNNRQSGVEMYNFGRFCAITGKAIQALEPTEEQDGINYVYNRYHTRSCNAIHVYSSLLTGNSTHSDRWVISHARNIQGQRGRDFCTLFDGDISAYESASEADSALCTLLAFWCDRDQGQIDRIFRQSGLYRPKWEREDYRIRTIRHACTHIPESLSEYQQRMYKERAMAIADER